MTGTHIHPRRPSPIINNTHRPRLPSKPTIQETQTSLHRTLHHHTANITSHLQTRPTTDTQNPPSIPHLLTTTLHKSQQLPRQRTNNTTTTSNHHQRRNRIRSRTNPRPPNPTTPKRIPGKMDRISRIRCNLGTRRPPPQCQRTHY